MSYEAVVLSVLIASPSDTAHDRDRVEQVIASWNRDRSRASKVVLLPLRWEFDAVAELGSGDGQAIINKQLVQNADIVVGLFHSRLGGATPRAVSGTAEEIDLAVSAGAKVHVYFSEMPHPSNLDTDQLASLRQFRKEMQDRGLVGSYASLDDLAAKVRTALERDVEQITSQPKDTATSAPPETPEAILRFRYAEDREPEVDSRGHIRMKSRRNRLELENIGAAPADDIEFTIEAASDGPAPTLHGEQKAERIRPHESLSFPVLAFAEMADRWLVTVRWREGERHFEDRQTITAM